MIPQCVLGIVLAAAPQPLPGTLSFADATRSKVTLDEPGMLYLVDFWAEGCKPCIEELPELERLAKEFEPTGRFRLISVLWGGWSGEELPKFAERYGATHPFYSDPERWLERLGKIAFPTKLLIRDGKILQRRIGGGSGAYDRWRKVVAEALERP